MLEALGDDAEGERLDASDRLVSVLTVGHNARQCRDFGQPAAIVLSLDFNRERHNGNVPSGPAVQQGAAPDAARVARAPQSVRASADALAGRNTCGWRSCSFRC
jgi:hypothetical protein